MPTLDDARATIRSAIIEGLARSADRTGLRAGRSAEIIADDVLTSVLATNTRWALRAFAEQEQRRDHLAGMGDTIVQAILSDLCGRRGLRQEWDEIDTDVQLEIIDTWRRLAGTALSADAGEGEEEGTTCES